MKAGLVLLVLTVCACNHGPASSAITRIVLSRNECNARCSFSQYVLYPDGRVDFTNGLQFTLHGRLARKDYRTLTDELVREPAFGPRWDYLADPSQQPQTTIWTEYSGRHWQVRFPTSGQAVSSNAEVRKLDAWARFATMQANAAISHEREAHVARLMRVDMLRRVTFTSNGCFGTCPAYTVTFSDDGRALMRAARFVRGLADGRSVNARATVPFEKVRELLSASGFASLYPQYPLRTIDVYGVSFEFDYRDGYSYTVSAPDETQWPPEVAGLAGSFTQLVRDTHWTPAP